MLIIIGLVVVLVPNIIAQWDSITASAGRMAAGEMTLLSGESGAFGPALWSAVLYFFFQLASVSVMYQHVEPVTDPQAYDDLFAVNTFARGSTNILTPLLFGVIASAFSAEYIYVLMAIVSVFAVAPVLFGRPMHA